ARFFAEAGVPLHDADAAVHRLYGGDAAPAIETAFPGATVDGKVDRDRLAARVIGDPAAMKRLERIVHPLVRREQERFLHAAAAGAIVFSLSPFLRGEGRGEGLYPRAQSVRRVPLTRRPSLTLGRRPLPAERGEVKRRNDTRRPHARDRARYRNHRPRSAAR